ncbi:hypothetical protein AXF42_Ash003249 [Apostasia shenzhenica]|uniref:Uncharacterized protein n=1 Tax=Apostasia shenzhenica TaxID=1088818 RepID=A0A2I0BFL4_9ASPA|nr:hypothetical protein AXF42_Ash003249 [Apostasia shenzhenica]
MKRFRINGVSKYISPVSTKSVLTHHPYGLYACNILLSNKRKLLTNPIRRYSTFLQCLFNIILILCHII